MLCSEPVLWIACVYFCSISSFYAFFRLFSFTHEPRIHWKSEAGKVELNLPRFG